MTTISTLVPLGDRQRLSGVDDNCPLQIAEFPGRGRGRLKLVDQLVADRPQVVIGQGGGLLHEIDRPRGQRIDRLRGVLRRRGKNQDGQRAQGHLPAHESDSVQPRHDQVADHDVRA